MKFRYYCLILLISFAVIYVCNLSYIYYFVENPSDYMDNLQYAKDRSFNLLVGMGFTAFFTLVFWAPGKTLMDWTEYDDVRAYGRRILRFLACTGLVILALLLPRLELRNYAYLKQVNEETIDNMVKNLEAREVIFTPESPATQSKRHGLHFSIVTDVSTKKKYMISCINPAKKSRGGYCGDVFNKKYKNTTQVIKVFPFYYKKNTYPTNILFEIQGDPIRNLSYYTILYKSEIKTTRVAILSTCLSILVVLLLTFKLFRE